jgi:hypothetical protein
MTFTWWLVPIIILGIPFVLAPVLGRAWADRDEERRRWAREMRRRNRPRRWRL